MASTKFLYCSLAVVLVVGSVSAEIIGSSILFRHGARTPETVFPNLPCTTCGDLQNGQLTKTGSRELYENGVMLRLKYLHLMPKDGFFNKDNMKIISSKSDRCIMSLQSFMAGFLPPPLLDMTLPIHWQPFTFEVDTTGRMIYFNQDPASCPNYMAMMQEVMSNPNPVTAQWLLEDAAVIQEASRLLGTELSGSTDVGYACDTLKILDIIDPKNTPQWAKDLYQNTFKKYGMSFGSMFSTTEMLRIRGGPLLNEILVNMEALAKGEEAGRPVAIYSAHDITVSSLAHILHVEDQIPQPISFSDTMTVDLTDDGKVQVRYMDNANTVTRWIDMNVPGCGTSCSLSTFRAAVQHNLVTSDAELDQLCGL